VWQLGPGNVDVKCCDERVHRVAFEAKCRETTMNYARLVSVMAITRFPTGLSWHFHSLKDEVLKIELEDISADLRLTVRWLSHQALTSTIFSLPRNTPCSPLGWETKKAER